jgi:hypothetical protein
MSVGAARSRAGCVASGVQTDVGYGNTSGLRRHAKTTRSQRFSELTRRLARGRPSARHGFTPMDADCLVSTRPEFRINVDQMCKLAKLNYVAGAVIPKRYMAK